MPSGGFGGTWGGGPWGSFGGTPGVDFLALPISSTEIRLKFQARVEDNGTPTNISSYVLDSLELPGSFFLPTLISAKFEDPGNRAVILTYNKPLTYTKYYRIAAFGLKTAIGNLDISSLPHQFLSTVPDPPRAFTSHLSDVDKIVIIFDSNLNASSSVATAAIRPSGTVGPGTPLVFSSLGPNSIVYTLNPVLVAADEHEIIFAGVVSESLNVGASTVPLNLKLRVAVPYSYADMVQAQIINAHVWQSINNALNLGTYIRVYFNVPMLEVDVEDATNWTVTTPGANFISDPSNILILNPLVDPIIAVATEVSTKFNSHISKYGIHNFGENGSTIESDDTVKLDKLVALANDIRIQYEAHRIQSGVHPSGTTLNDLTFILTAPAATDLNSTINLLNDIRTKYILHIASASFHLVIDATNTVAWPVATNIYTAALLVEDLKRKFNFHRTQVGVHTSNDTVNVVTAQDPALFITSPVATNDATSIAIINEAQTKYLNHLILDHLHKFDDGINSFVPVFVSSTDVPTARIILNTSYYPKFNSHVDDTYIAPISSIRYFNSGTFGSPPEDPFYSVAEIRIASQFDVNTLFSLVATVDNATSTSTTNPLNETGSITINQLNFPGEVINSNLNSKTALNIRFNQEIKDSREESLILDSNGVGLKILSINEKSSVVNSYFFLDYIIDAYDLYHRVQTVHVVPDTVNTFPGASRPFVSSNIVAANELKSVLNDHIQSITYHYVSDTENLITAPDATDFGSLQILMRAIIDGYLSHVVSTTAHKSVSLQSLASGLTDIISVEFDSPKNDEEYETDLKVLTKIIDNVNGRNVSYNVNAQTSFIGKSQPPSIASAFTEIGLQPTYEEGKFLTPDWIQGFLSKPMRQQELLAANIMIPGVIIKKLMWINERVVGISVIDMSTISYNITVSGLSDKSGNLVI